MPTLAAHRSEHELLPHSGSARSWRRVVVGVGIAIGVTAAMDATGLTAFSALPLCLSAVVLPTGFDVPATQVPIFLANAFVIGVALALIRMTSGSIAASSVTHGVRNGLAYVFSSRAAEA